MHNLVIDYSKSRFQDADTERAYDMVLDGLAEAEFSPSEAEWYALVVLDGRCRIIREDQQGFVWTDYEESSHSVDHDRLRRAWDEIAWECDVEEP
jgi:hypothetical protein